MYMLRIWIKGGWLLERRLLEHLLVSTWNFYPTISFLCPLFSIVRDSSCPPVLLTLHSIIFLLLQNEVGQLMFSGSILIKSTQLKISAYNFSFVCLQSTLIQSPWDRESIVFVSVPCLASCMPGWFPLVTSLLNQMLTVKQVDRKASVSIGKESRRGLHLQISKWRPKCEYAISQTNMKI